MPWGRLDDGLYDHPKLEVLGRLKLPAIGLWTLAISWSNRRSTDGFIPSDRIRALGGSKSLAEALVDCGLFDEIERGYMIHDFLEFNDSAEQVRVRREAAAERQRKRRHGDVTADVTPVSQRESQRDKGVSHSTPRVRAGARPGPARPNPVPDLENPQTPASGGQGRRANGTSPRQVAAAEQSRANEEGEAKRYRRNQRQLAYARGAITEAQHQDMNARDASLEEIPDRAAHLASLAADEDWLGVG